MNFLTLYYDEKLKYQVRHLLPDLSNFPIEISKYQASYLLLEQAISYLTRPRSH